MSRLASWKIVLTPQQRTSAVNEPQMCISPLWISTGSDTTCVLCVLERRSVRRNIKMGSVICVFFYFLCLQDCLSFFLCIVTVSLSLSMDVCILPSIYLYVCMYTYLDRLTNRQKARVRETERQRQRQTEGRGWRIYKVYCISGLLIQLICLCIDIC